MIKIAMSRVYDCIQQSGLVSRMLLQVHDELLFDLASGEEDALQEIVVREMQNAMDLGVPIVVDVGVGQNWLEAH